ncbi:MAG TPA: bifunctional adenosylcobinamide kinase/adenosylcobinamide-phosphate guanylyltransferase [Polyangia bacterium]
MASRLILIGGGARSGKSAFALSYARALGAQRVFVATAQAYDDEMRARIDRHRDERGPDFTTIEEPVALARAITEAPRRAVVLVDCLTLWLSNRLCADASPETIHGELEEVVRAAVSRAAPTLVVSNEVGMGVVPDNALARAFRDLTGHAHQRLAAAADEIYAALMGVVLRLHPGPLEMARWPFEPGVASPPTVLA